MIAHYGMSERLGLAYYDYEVEHPFLGQRVATDGGASDATHHAIEREAQKALARALALAGASALLAAHRAELDLLVHSLLEAETLEAEDLKRLLGVPATTPPASLPGLAATVALAR
jgi:cell division protease FtsH